MTVHGMPGIGGSLGQCVICGRTFVMELLTGDSVQRVGIDGIKGDVCLHEACMPDLERARDEGWETLPETGPLYRVFAEAAKSQEA